MTIQKFLFTMAITVFALGFASTGGGIFILITKVIRDDIKVIAKETTEIAQKGIADDISGLVGNASALVNSLNELVQTTAGIAAALVVLGIILMLSSYLMTTQFI